MKSIFITGTDTDIGKTYVTTRLLKQFNAENYTTFGIKPIASGCQRNNSDDLLNDDALALQAAASLQQPYPMVNPIALEAPIAPHLAAKQMGIQLSAKDVSKTITDSIQSSVDINIIEGVGGWMVPLNEHTLFSEVITALNIPVILVVGIKLGCLNHAILTSQQIIQQKAHLVGWIANCLEPNTLVPQENIQTLKQWIPAPCLGVTPHPFDIATIMHAV